MKRYTLQMVFHHCFSFKKNIAMDLDIHDKIGTLKAKSPHIWEIWIIEVRIMDAEKMLLKSTQMACSYSSILPLNFSFTIFITFTYRDGEASGHTNRGRCFWPTLSLVSNITHHAKETNLPHGTSSEDKSSIDRPCGYCAEKQTPSKAIFRSGDMASFHCSSLFNAQLHASASDVITLKS